MNVHHNTSIYDVLHSDNQNIQLESVLSLEW